jgi:hypothetical protein
MTRLRNSAHNDVLTVLFSVLFVLVQYLPGQRSLDTVSAKIFRRKKGGGERRALSADR